MGAKQKAKVYLLIASLQAVMVAFLMFWAGSSSTVSAATGINSQLSFEGKIVKSDGTNITNGTYNMEFKIYQDGTNTGSGSTLKWTEDRLVGGSGGVTLTDGTFQVNLGSVNPFGSQVDWNQDTLWLSMQIGNSSSCTISTTFQSNCGGDGEMTPYIRLTAVPYANNAAALGGIAASGFIQNGTSPQTANFNVVSGSSGSVTATIQGASGQSVDIAEIKVNGVSNPVFKVASDGSTTVQSPNAQGSLTAMQIQNSTGASLLTADTTNMRLGVNVTYTAMSAPTQNPLNYSPTGGSLSGSVYYYRVTAIDAAGGETLPSAEKAISGLTGTTNQITVSWSAVTGATAYRVYRADSSFSETYLATTSNTSFIDTGSVTLGTAPYPSTNTAYISTNNSNSSLQLTVGGLGTPTGQAYISGTQPMFRGQNTDSKLSGANNIYVQGRYAYVANYNNNKLDIYDVSNPANPSFVGENSDSNLSTPSSVQVQGRYAYVISTGNNKLEVYDVSNPSAPTYVAATAGYDYASSPLAVYVQGRYAYVASYSNSLLIAYDISNPYNITYLSAIGSGISYPNSIYVAGKYAYVTNAVTNKLAVCNISNPSSMSCVTNSDSNLSSPNAVYVQGRYAYVSSMSSNKLKIYDVSNPLSPTYLSQNSDSNLSSPNAVYVQGRYAYVVSSGNSKLEVYDVSNPSAPTYVTQNADSKMSSPQGVYIQGRYAYVIGGSKLSSYDLGGTYTQQLEAGGTETGTLQVNAGGQVNGDFNIGGALQVSQNIQTSGDMGVVGAVNITGNVTIGGETSQLAIPSAPTVTPQGTTGFQRWDYQITAVDSYGDESPASLSGTTSSGNSTLTVSNYNTISWSSVSGAASYNIYRTYATGGNPSSKGYIGNTASTTFNDTGSNGVGSLTNPPQFKVNGQAWFRVKTDSSSAFQIQGASTSTLFTANSVTRTAGTTGNMIKIGNSSGTDTTTTVLQLASSNGTLTTNLTSLNGGLYYNSSTNHVNVIENGAVKELCNKTDLSCGATPTLASSYNSASTTGNTITLAQSGAGVKIQDAPTPITGSDLFDVQSNGGATTYLGVSSANSGTTSISGRLYTPNLDSASGTLTIGNNNATAINIGNTTSNITTTISGTVLVKPTTTHDSTTAFQVQSAGGGNLLTVDSQNSQVITTSLAAQSAGTVLMNNSVVLSPMSSFPVSAVAVDSSGLPRVIYKDASDNLIFAQCTVQSCATKVTTNLGNISYSQDASIAMGSDGYARIAYYNYSTADLNFVQCTNASCSTNVVTAVDTLNDVGSDVSLTMGQDGYARIAYKYNTSNDLRYAQCTNASCSTNVITTVDSTDSVGNYASIAMGSDGFARIAYFDSTTSSAMLAQCTNDACSSSVITSVSAAYAYGGESVAMGSDGYPVITYVGSDFNLYVAKCTNASCSTNTKTNIDPSASGMGYLSVKVGSDGYPKISYSVGAGYSNLRLVSCTSIDCTTSSLITVDSTNGSVGQFSALAIASSGYMYISYGDFANSNMKLAQLFLPGSLGASIVQGSSVGTVGNPFGQIYAKALDLGTLSVNGTGFINLRPLYDSSSLLQVQNASGTSLLSVDSVNKQVNLIAAKPINSISITVAADSIVVDSGTSSIASVLGSDGNGRIAQVYGSIKYYKCLNANCANKTTTTIAGPGCGSSANATALAIAPDGFARIAYYDCSSNNLKYLQCTNDACSSSVGSTVDATTGVGQDHIAMAIAPDGFARIAYYASSTGDLKFVQCTNASCSADVINTVDSTGAVGRYPALTIAADGFARISYRDDTNGYLKFAQCTNAACSTSVINIVDTGVYNPSYPDWGTSSIVMGTNGFPAISYYGTNGNYLQLLQCSNAACSTSTKNTIDTGIVGGYSSMAINGSGTFYISYYADYTLDLKLATVTSSLSITKSTLDSTGDVGAYSSLSLDASGNARISYYDATNIKLKYVVQNSSRAAVTGSDLGSLTSRFGNIYAANINSNYFGLQSSTNTTTAFQIMNSAGITIFNVDTINNSVSVSNPTNSTTAFQVQNSSGTQVFSVDTVNGGISVGASTNNVAITTAAGVVLSGSARHQKSISLSAEYPGAVMTPTSGNSHTGSMTSDFDTTNFHNYYDWTSTVAGSDYDIFVRVPIPADFSAWNGVGTVNVWGTVLGDSVTFAVWDTANTSVCASSSLVSATATWQTVSATTPTTPCNYTASGTYTAGGTMTLRIRLTATNANDHVRVAAINLPYFSKW